MSKLSIFPLLILAGNEEDQVHHFYFGSLHLQVTAFTMSIIYSLLQSLNIYYMPSTAQNYHNPCIATIIYTTTTVIFTWNIHVMLIQFSIITCIFITISIIFIKVLQSAYEFWPLLGTGNMHILQKACRQNCCIFHGPKHQDTPNLESYLWIYNTGSGTDFSHVL